MTTVISKKQRQELIGTGFEKVSHAKTLQVVEVDLKGAGNYWESAAKDFKSAGDMAPLISIQLLKSSIAMYRQVAKESSDSAKASGYLETALQNAKEIEKDEILIEKLMPHFSGGVLKAQKLIDEIKKELTHQYSETVKEENMLKNQSGVAVYLEKIGRLNNDYLMLYWAKSVYVSAGNEFNKEGKISKADVMYQRALEIMTEFKEALQCNDKDFEKVKLKLFSNKRN